MGEVMTIMVVQVYFIITKILIGDYYNKSYLYIIGIKIL
jgi:hypothetical protein